MTGTRNPITPGEFFSGRELNAQHSGVYDTAEQLWDALTAEQEKLDSATRGTQTSDLGCIRQHCTDSALYFRGQSNHSYGLSTSLHRFMRSENSNKISERTLAELERAVLEQMTGRGLGRGMTRGELLMVLQHHGGPTRLMDVSDRPLEALYFAVEGADAIDGRLFILAMTEQEDDGHRMSLSGESDLPWAQYARGMNQATSEWTIAVKLIDERPLDPRMLAQRGRFLVGGLQRAYSEWTVTHEGVALNAEELQTLSTLTIGFLKRNNRKSKWPALGWTIRIPATEKPRLRELLCAEGISHETMYPDLASTAWQSYEAARNENFTHHWRDKLNADA
ncbi:FRG domain-containing protein [Clavibacter michiganensis]|uniref:FRG domain-containing protein n=1 Tax=Clavibacter michiganensis TaxID=28447 RepID=UPI0026DD91DE|nr:FRG domain-containing protein [Clavibacter michiganensis]MDO4027413.1 FRG domain-containing protein [Clavibacter michiganensis]MDO4065472.1 FRG domain-containing protein [Clavibacter michiganensis]MDO4070765.1 FRG domain-containing protein [Clavibacter michiganensis]MDO4089185.1 FRG domain-containing protein [Clavibacter michiganensis]